MADMGPVPPGSLLRRPAEHTQDALDGAHVGERDNEGQS